MACLNWKIFNLTSITPENFYWTGIAPFPKFICLTSININSYLVTVRTNVPISNMKNPIWKTPAKERIKTHFVIKVNYLGWTS